MAPVVRPSGRGGVSSWQVGCGVGGEEGETHNQQWCRTARKMHKIWESKCKTTPDKAVCCTAELFFTSTKSRGTLVLMPRLVSRSIDLSFEAYHRTTMIDSCAYVSLKHSCTHSSSHAVPGTQ